MLAISPTLNITQTETILKLTAKPFGTGHTCHIFSCGAGIVNAHAALLYLLPQRAFVPIVIAEGSGSN
jgi:hypothetical protein